MMERGATEGERAAARKAAERIAAAAGMTLADALSKLDAKPKQSSFDFQEAWRKAQANAQRRREQEERDRARRERERAEHAARLRERERRNALRRAAILRQYGSKEYLFAATDWEKALAVAVEQIATWDYWTDQAGIQHRFAAMLDGKKEELWRVEEITPAIREAVTTAYSWPSNLDTALLEVKTWDRLRQDRGLFCDHNEFSHGIEVECRITLLEHGLDTKPVASWDDMQARFDWKRHEFERGWLDPTEREDPFLDRLEADFDFLRDMASVHFGHRTTTADKQAAVLSMLDSHPDLSDREIARRCGVSPQTVNNWRKRMAA